VLIACTVARVSLALLRIKRRAMPVENFTPPECSPGCESDRVVDCAGKN